MNSETDLIETERRRSYLMISLVGYLGVLFLVVFGANALLKSNHDIGGVLLFAAALGVGSLIAMRVTGDQSYGANGVSVAVFIICTFLIAKGGVDGTGPLWCYPCVLLLVFLQGVRKGAIALGLLMSIIVVLMFVPDLPVVDAEYTTSFKIRFIASFAAFAAMTLIYEYLRRSSQQKYLAISSDLVRASRTDALTGLSNRRDMQELLESQYSLYARHGQPFSVIMADLDHFKQINDRCGHPGGDFVLAAVSALLTTKIRRHDRVARWGGEEFLIMLPHTESGDAAFVAEKLRNAIEALDLSERSVDMSVSASFGVQCVDEVDSLDALLVGADRMLYQAKRLGRNRVVSRANSERSPVSPQPDRVTGSMTGPMSDPVSESTPAATFDSSQA